MFPIWDAIKNDINEGSKGKFAKHKKYVLALLHLRGDWPAVCEALGCRQWSHARHPCLKCKIPLDKINSDAMFACSCDDGPYDEYSDEDYFADVNKHLIIVCVGNNEIRSLIYSSLRYESAGLGRTLFRDLATLGLKSGDRLLPTTNMPDVALLESMATPCTIHFWRIGISDRLLYPSPLMWVEGMSLRRYCIDLMHAWHLGVLQYFIGYVFWLLLRSNVWDCQIPWINQKEQWQLGLLQLKSEMWQYYAKRKQEDEHFARSGSTVLCPSN